MRNLLPIESKKVIRREYMLRITGIGLIFVFFVFLFSSVFLLPSFFLSIAKEESVRDSAEIVRKSVELREQNSADILLEEAKQKLKLLSVDKESIFVQDVVKKITGGKTEGLSIHGISYMDISGGRHRIALTGMAKDRDLLLSFRRYLEKEEIFTDVRLPVSNLVKDKDIEFSIEVEIEHDHKHI